MIVSTDGEESRLIDDECELSMQHPATSEICGSQSDDVVHPICVKPDVERDHSVEAPGTEGSDLVVDTRTNAATSSPGPSPRSKWRSEKPLAKAAKWLQKIR